MDHIPESSSPEESRPARGERRGPAAAGGPRVPRRGGRAGSPGTLGRRWPRAGAGGGLSCRIRRRGGMDDSERKLGQRDPAPEKRRLSSGPAAEAGARVVERDPRRALAAAALREEHHDSQGAPRLALPPALSRAHRRPRAPRTPRRGPAHSRRDPGRAIGRADSRGPELRPERCWAPAARGDIRARARAPAPDPPPGSGRRGGGATSGHRGGSAELRRCPGSCPPLRSGQAVAKPQAQGMDTRSPSGLLLWAVSSVVSSVKGL